MLENILEFMQPFSGPLIALIIAVFAERVLIIYGLARGNMIGLVVVTLFLALMKQFIDYEGSFYFYGLVIIIAVMSVNRADLTMTLRYGRWWWKSENLPKDQNKDTLQGGVT